MASDRTTIRVTPEREQLIAAVEDRYPEVDGFAAAIDTGLKAAIQLDEITEAQAEQLRERANELSGDAISVTTPTRRK